MLRAVATAALSAATPLVYAQSAVSASSQASATTDTSRMVVSDTPLPSPTPNQHDDFRPKLDHIMREVEGTQITVTKKATVIKLEQQPQVVNNNQQEIFNRAPGLLVTEQNTPSQFNLSYRGLGNPQESEYVLALQDGLPIMTDWIGFPTLYYVPLPQSVSEIQVIRGGSSLLYGPEPAPAINFVSRRPTPGEPFTASTEHLGGADGLYSTYNYVEGTQGNFEYRTDFGYVHSDGQRENSQSDLFQGDFYLGFRPDKDQLWYVDFNADHVSADNPGRISYAQFLADSDFSPTPYNHDWIDRYHVTLGHDHEFGGGWLLQAKAWFTFQELDSRAAGNLSPTGVAPATTQVQNESFYEEGLDVRLRKKWGQGNALTVGALVYHSDAPFVQYINPNLYADRDDESGTTRLDQDRTADYQAFFIENVFRWGKFHVVPSFRLDHENVAIDENVKPGNFARALASENVGRTIPLWGIGLGNDFGKGNETYFSASSGWRPLRYFDVVSPFSPTFQPGHPTDPFESLDLELGVHGTPLKGLWYDVGLFWMEFSNRTESQLLNPGVNNDTIQVNSGTSRHRGFEGELAYDLFALCDHPALTGSHLTIAGNLQLLDAEFTESANPTLIGNRPAFAPDVVAKGSLTYRMDNRGSVSFSGVYVSSQFWQDSNLPTATIPAKVPSYLVFNLTGQWNLTKNVRVLAGLTNLADEHYYSRVFGNGIEPAPRRSAYAGLALTF